MLKQGDAHKKGNPHSVEHAAGVECMLRGKEIPMKTFKQYVLLLLPGLVLPAVMSFAVGCGEGERIDSSGIPVSPQMWCVRQDDHYDVQEVENCRLASVPCDAGVRDCEHTVCDYGDVVGSCPLTQYCGQVIKLISAQSADQKLAAATYYQFEVYKPKTFLIHLDNGRSDGDVDIVEADSSTSGVIDLDMNTELWIGCEVQAAAPGIVSSKGSICLDGSVYKLNSGTSGVPSGLPAIDCTCNGASTTYRGFDFCTDFDCPLDADPNVAPQRCPNFPWP